MIHFNDWDRYICCFMPLYLNRENNTFFPLPGLFLTSPVLAGQQGEAAPPHRALRGRHQGRQAGEALLGAAVSGARLSSSESSP